MRTPQKITFMAMHNRNELLMQYVSPCTTLRDTSWINLIVIDSTNH